MQGIEVFNIDNITFRIKSSEKVMEYVANPIKISSVTERGIAPWGTNNDMPQQVIELISSNPVAMAALEHKIDITFGAGIKIGKYVNGDFIPYTSEELTKGNLAEVNQFFVDNEIQQTIAELITDLQWFSNGFVEIILNLDNPNIRKITKINQLEAAYSRLELMNAKTGIIEKHIYSGKFPEIPKKEETEVTPIISSVIDLEERLGRRPNNLGKINAEKVYRYVLPLQLATPGKLYYAEPCYYSIIKSGWLDFSNAIPKYKKAYMQNNMSISYIVEISDKYFARIFNVEGITDTKKQLERKRKEIDNINTYLRGVDAAGKSMITYYRDSPNGKEPVPEIIIKVLKKSEGGEFIEDSHEASAMIYTAFRVHPSLIGVIPGKTTSNLSGSDKRELLRISQSLQGRIRNLALKPLYLIKRINNWAPEIEFAFEDRILTTLDQGREVQTMYN